MTICKECGGVGRIQYGEEWCSACNGTGEVQEQTKIKCDDCKFEPDCVDYGWEECKKFTPTKKTKTIFDDITSSPERLAEFIHTVTQQCHECGATGKVKIKGCAVRQTFAPDFLFLPCMDKAGTEDWLKEEHHGR